MFGAFRLLLATLVVFSHLTGSGYLSHFGYYAVRGFFVLSGFVITAALNDVYAFDARRFWTNRLLRLLPLYYVTALMTLSVVLIQPDQAKHFTSFWDGPNTIDLLGNLFLLDLQANIVKFRLVMPAWSIAVELTMYVVLFYFVAPRPMNAWIVLGLGVAYHAICCMIGFDWSVRYFPALSSLFSFALGAVLYFLKRDRRLRLDPKWIGPALVLWAMNLAAGGWLFPDAFTYDAGYYLNTLLSGVIILSLAAWRPGPKLCAADKALGDLAYPVFLIHWVVGFLVALAFFPDASKSWELAAASTPLILGSAIVLAKFNACWIEPLRTRVRAGRPSPDRASPSPRRSLTATIGLTNPGADDSRVLERARPAV